MQEILESERLVSGTESDSGSAVAVFNRFQQLRSQKKGLTVSFAQHSLASLRQVLEVEFGRSFAKGYLERLLKNPFYKGQFIWEGKTYQGTHTPHMSPDLFEQAQAVFQGHNKPKYRKHAFAFGGLLRCAYDNCLVTAEFKKNKYTYYRCTGYRGKCELPYFREPELGDRLGRILKDIHIPDEVLAQLEKSLLTDKAIRSTSRGSSANDCSTG